MTGVSAEEFAEIHDELRTVARDLLERTGAGNAVDWIQLVRAGWLGLAVSGEFDGADATFAEVAVVLEEMGRSAARGPYPSVASSALTALDLAVPNSGRDALLRDTVAGKSVPIVALSAETPNDNVFRLMGPTNALTLHGVAELVPDAPCADRLLVPALGMDGTRVIVDVDARASGVRVVEQPVVDATRCFGRVVAEDVSAAPEAVWQLRVDPERAMQRLFDGAAVAVACDSLGVSAAMLDATVAYTGMREQFGRKIGSFQAVKHACADMLVQLSVARRLVDAAVHAHAAGAADAAVAVSMAKAFTGTAAVQIAGMAMQLHGGIG
ncbi:MAG: acyl-CoA/acyl-ACP dehydrogenase, partial [Aldersonia sp.]|nr:acyl-CoA/acyl-ACP dehydrogenase [Aldersonia sp.]